MQLSSKYQFFVDLDHKSSFEILRKTSQIVQLVPKNRKSEYLVYDTKYIFIS